MSVWKAIVVHGVRLWSELGLPGDVWKDLFEDELLGEYVKDKLIYYPTVTREPFCNEGRMTDLMKSGKLFKILITPHQSKRWPRDDFGSPSMNKDVAALLMNLVWKPSPRMGGTGDYVVERAFVEQ